MRPLLGIITASHNRPQPLARCIQSVLRQPYPRWRMYVVDDASSERFDTIGLDQRVSYHRFGTTQGANKARNLALNQALGDQCDYVIFVDDGDYLTPNALADAVAAIAKHPGVQWLVSNCSCLDSQGREAIAQLKGGLVLDYINDYLYQAQVSGAKSHCIASAAIGKRRFDERIENTQEWTFFFQLRKHPMLSSAMVSTIKENPVDRPADETPNREQARQQAWWALKCPLAALGRRPFNPTIWRWLIKRSAGLMRAWLPF